MLMQIGTNLVVHGQAHETINIDGQLKGQRSRSHEVEGKSGGLAEASRPHLVEYSFAFHAFISLLSRVWLSVGGRHTSANSRLSNGM